MLIEGVDATRAAFEVGYESRTQFNREYAFLRATTNAPHSKWSALGINK